MLYLLTRKHCRSLLLMHMFAREYLSTIHVGYFFFFFCENENNKINKQQKTERNRQIM